jgi:hypothetical protein
MSAQPKRRKTSRNLLSLPDVIWEHHIIPTVGPRTIFINCRSVSKFMNVKVWQEWTINGLHRFPLYVFPSTESEFIYSSAYEFDKTIKFVKHLQSLRDFIKEEPLIFILEEGKHIIKSSYFDPDHDIISVGEDEYGQTRITYATPDEDTVDLPNNISIVGKGKDKTTLVGSVILNNKKGVSIKHLKLKGDIRVLGTASHLQCEDCGIGYANNNALDVEEDCVVTAKNCIFEMVGEGSEAAHISGTGHFTNCTFQHTHSRGVSVVGNGVVNFSGATLIFGNNQCGLDLTMMKSETGGLCNIRGRLSFRNNGWTGNNGIGQFRQGGDSIRIYSVNGQTGNTYTLLDGGTVTLLPDTMYNVAHASCSYWNGVEPNTDNTA